MKVLSVDDSRTARHAIRNMTEVLDLEFLEAENGLDALRLLETHGGDIDLIILDWEMPVMNGKEFLEKMKRHERHRNIPVIMVTTVTQKDKVIDAIRSGASQYITKPFSGEDLLAKIVQTLGIDNGEFT